MTRRPPPAAVLCALCTLCLAALLALPLRAPAAAPDFAPVIRVDGAVITGFELEQRIRFLTLLGVQGDIAREAETGLIDDRLRQNAARRFGVRLSPEQLRAGMTEFAGRANLSVEEFVAILEENGVAAATFRDFVDAGLLWRELVRARFLDRARAVSEADIDRALTLEMQRLPTARVLLSEIVLPAGRNAEAQRLAETLQGEPAFAAAARERSVAASAADGGRIDWVPLPYLPPQIAQAIAGLTVGQISPPVIAADGVALYLLRGIEPIEAITPQVTQVEYAIVLIPGAGTAAAAAEAARLRQGADRCGDLWGLTQGGADRVRVESRLLSATPAGIAAELARLDVGGVSTRLVRDGAKMFLMLCARRLESGLPPSREAVRERITLERLEGFARIWLAEMRVQADIRRR
jgi:peptidyl-prolyl cis-trans isomerase SurA